MADPTHPGSSGGCLRSLLSFFIMMMVCGLGAAMFFVSQPQDLSDIGMGGFGPVSSGENSRDLRAVLRASLDRGHKVTISETEINSWLARTLEAKQGGPLAEWISMGRVCVRLEENMAEIIMERRAFGRPFTVSMFVKIEQTEEKGRVRTVIERHGGPYSPDLPKPMRGGRFGRLVVPQGFLMLVVPAYEQLAGTYQEEIHLAFEEMSRIRIEPNRLVLDPRPDSNSTEVF
jgi:hypothetical protein